MSDRLSAARAALVDVVRRYAPVHQAVSADAQKHLNAAMDELQAAAVAGFGAPSVAPPIPPGAQPPTPPAGAVPAKPVKGGNPAAGKAAPTAPPVPPAAAPKPAAPEQEEPQEGDKPA